MRFLKRHRPAHRRKEKNTFVILESSLEDWMKNPDLDILPRMVRLPPIKTEDLGLDKKRITFNRNFHK